MRARAIAVAARGGRLIRLLAAGVALAACTLHDAVGTGQEGAEGEEPDLLQFDLERMIYQERYDLWEASPYFPDGKVMRQPPDGTVARDDVVGDPGLTEGMVGGVYVERIPIPLTAETMRHGRGSFETYCAPCHGVLGDGMSQVATNMELRRPPSLIAAPVSDFPVGRIYQAIHLGYGLMRSYSSDLTLEERWAVVAYVRALQRSRAVALDTLPAPVRDRALKELP